jgi:orotidine-5'-phosphate decarboxylase
MAIAPALLTPQQRLIVALDVPTAQEALALVATLQPAGLAVVKVGMSLFYQAGLPLINELHAQGLTVFVDLKLHDIPSTVARTATVLLEGGVRWFNVHTLGGADMMTATMAAVTASGLQAETTVLGVTLLTSHTPDSLPNTLGVPCQLPPMVTHLAQQAHQAGLNGVVCSPHEAQAIAQAHGEAFLRVCPGIRLPTDELGDQSRVLTPALALQAGATHLVVGRPVYHAPNPLVAYQTLLASLC